MYDARTFTVTGSLTTNFTSDIDRSNIVYDFYSMGVELDGISTFDVRCGSREEESDL